MLKWFTIRYADISLGWNDWESKQHDVTSRDIETLQVT